MKDPFEIARKYLEKEFSRPDYFDGQEPESERPDPEALTVKILAEFNPDEAERIVTAWREIMGVDLDPRCVRSHLKALSQWQSQLQRR